MKGIIIVICVFAAIFLLSSGFKTDEKTSVAAQTVTQVVKTTAAQTATPSRENGSVEFTIETSGNTASKTWYITVRVEMENLDPNTSYPVTLGKEGADDPSTKADLSYTKRTGLFHVQQMENPQTIISNGNGTVVSDFYIHHGQYITIGDLPDGATCRLSLIDCDYEIRPYTVNGTETDSNQITVSGDKPQTIVINLFRASIIPTWVVIATGIGFLIAFVVVAVTFLTKNERRAAY